MPSVWAAALSKEYLKKNQKSSPSVALEKENKKKRKRKRRRPSANGVKSSPSASTALGKAFPECTIFDTRGRRLSRGRISRRLFPECCTRGRLPRVQLGLLRVQPALGEASSSCSEGTSNGRSWLLLDLSQLFSGQFRWEFYRVLWALNMLTWHCIDKERW